MQENNDNVKENTTDNKVETTTDNTQSKKKKPIIPIIIGGAAILLVIIAIIISIVVMVIVNGEPKEKIYLTEEETSLIYSSPDNYKKKYVKLTGQIMKVEYDKKGQTIRAITDIENYTNDIVVYFEDKTVSLKESDYISIDGYIKGSDKETSKPYIIAKEVKAISYMDAVAPTTKEITLDKTVAQNDVVVTVKKVEFSDVETRIYVKATNNSNYEFNLYSYSSFLTQAGKQYETTYSKNSVDMSSTILAGGSTEGVIVFPKIEQSNFTITMKGYSSNYDLDFENFAFDITVN